MADVARAERRPEVWQSRYCGRESLTEGGGEGSRLIYEPRMERRDVENSYNGKKEVCPKLSYEERKK